MNPGTKIYKISKLQLGKCLLTHDDGVSPVSRTTKYWTLPILTQNSRCIFQKFQQNQEKLKEMYKTQSLGNFSWEMF